MAEIIAEPTALSKVIPLKFKINDVDVPKTTQLSTNKQFNTTDTDAWFTFELDGLASTSGTYDLTLINLDDKSIFHHADVIFPALPFHYKLNSSEDVTLNEIRHAGRWLGQLVVTLSNGDTTARQFGFNISGHILDGQDAQVILLSDYQALINTINLAKDDLAQYNVDYAALLVDIAAAEDARVTAYNQLLADQQANIEAFDVALDEGIVAANLATKLQDFEATNNSRLLSAEQQLEQAESDVGQFYKSNYVHVKNFLPNAENPLSIPTYDGGNQPTHPKVLYFTDGWNGYKFWMAFTPYTGSNDDLENPCVVVSNDGTTWIVPPGLINPITSLTAEQLAENGFHSDTHIVMVGATMELWYRYATNSNNIRILRKTSTDGVTWSAEQQMIDCAVYGEGIISPALLFEDNKYKLWFINAARQVRYTESADGTTWAASTLCDVPALPVNYNFWHIDVIHTTRYEFLVSCDLNMTLLGNDLFYFNSADNVKFSAPQRIVRKTTDYDKFDNGLIYRSTMVLIDQEYWLFYAAKSSVSSWQIGLSKGESPLFLSGGRDIGIPTIMSAKDAYALTDAPTVYPTNRIVYTQITSGYAITQGFPESAVGGGTLITENVFKEQGFARQTYKVYKTNSVYIRYGNNTSWDSVTGWVRQAFRAPKLAAQSIVIGSIAANSSTDFIISYPGATTSDVIAMSVTTTPPLGLTFFVFCNADGSLKLRATNATVAAIDGGTRTFNFVALKL